MNPSKKRLLAYGLTLSMVLSVLPTISAEELVSNEPTEEIVEVIEVEAPAETVEVPEETVEVIPEETVEEVPEETVEDVPEETVAEGEEEVTEDTTAEEPEEIPEETVAEETEETVPEETEEAPEETEEAPEETVPELAEEEDEAEESLEAAALVIEAQPVDQNKAVNETAVFTVKVSGTVVSYQWQFKPVGGSWRDCSASTAGYNTDTLKPVATTTRNGYQYRCVITGESGTVTTDAATLNVGAASGLSITAQPKDQAVALNGTAVFTVAASGSNLKYQWQYKAGTNDWKNCSSTTAGYNTDTLKPVCTATRNGYQYRCVITDGNATVTSNAATMSLASGLKITTQPADQTVAVNEAAAFTVAVSSSDVTYQWQFTANGTDWKNCSSATVGYNTATVKPVGATSRNGYKYRCVITSGTEKVTSDAATLTVSASAAGIKITAQPTDQAVAANATAVFTVKAEGTNLKYQWQYKAGTNDWKNCSSTTAGYNTDTLKPVCTTTRNGYQYRCVITSGTTSVTSNAVTMTIGAAAGVKITTQPTSQTVTENETAVFTVVASGSSLKYQWQFKSATSDWKNCSSATAGYNTATLKPVGTAARNGYQYRCVVTSGSESVTSEIVTMKVTAAGIKITTQPTDLTVDVDTTATFTVVASGSNLKYQWQFRSATSDWKNCSSATAGYNTATLKPVGTAARNGYQYRCVITSGTEKVTSAEVTMTVNASSVKIVTQPTDQEVALNEAAIFTVEAEGTNLKYQWQFKSATSSWKNCSSATAGYNTATLKPIATEARNGYQYRCVVTSGTMSVTSDEVTMTIAMKTEITVNNVIYKLNDDGTAFVIGYEGTDSALTVEATVEGHEVTEIAAKAFEGNTNLEEITLPNCITAIRASAFAQCSKLASMKTY